MQQRPGAPCSPTRICTTCKAGGYSKMMCSAHSAHRSVLLFNFHKIAWDAIVRVSLPGSTSHDVCERSLVQCQPSDSSAFACLCRHVTAVSGVYVPTADDIDCLDRTQSAHSQVRVACAINAASCCCADAASAGSCARCFADWCCACRCCALRGWQMLPKLTPAGLVRRCRAFSTSRVWTKATGWASTPCARSTRSRGGATSSRSRSRTPWSRGSRTRARA